MAWPLAALAILTSALFALSAARRQGRTGTVESESLPEAVAAHGHDTFRPRASQAATEPEAVPPRSCPVCLREYSPQSRYCLHDGAPLLEDAQSGAFAQGMICPTCRRGYPADASFCPEDADDLVPYGLYGAASSTRGPIAMDSNKICPECGVRHAAVHLFCGHDGTELVVVN